jgi:hypothetical protein
MAVDRHLFSLRCLVKDGEPIPAIFGEAFVKHQTSVLSTSNVSVFGAAVLTAGFGAVCPEGYGLGYVCKDDRVDVCITCFTDDPDTGGAGFGGVKRRPTQAVQFDTDANKFADSLSWALDALKDLHV